jgi:steroid delta-isomerase-like uncharacterized protein
MALDSTNHPFLRKVLDAYNSHRVESFDELLTDDVVLVRNGTEVRGREAVKDVMSKLYRAFPDIEYDVDDVIVSGDKMVLRWNGRGTHRGDYFGIPPTGRTASYDGITLYELRGDRIARIWVTANVLALLRGIGAKAAQPEANV